MEDEALRIIKTRAPTLQDLLFEVGLSGMLASSHDRLRQSDRSLLIHEMQVQLMFDNVLLYVLVHTDMF